VIYLASPYSNDPQGNYDAMVDFCQRLTRRVPTPTYFSPVIQFHPWARDVPDETVIEWCLEILSRADGLWLVRLPGLIESRGCKMEFDFYFGRCKVNPALPPAVFVDPLKIEARDAGD
jgi:hypothetical protein